MEKKKINVLKKSGIIALLLALVVSTLSGCGLFDDDEPEKKSIEVGTTYERDAVATKSLKAAFGDNVVRDKRTKLKGDGKDKVTILLYVNGSNLESEDGEATTDLSEIVAAGSSKKVKIVAQTMGTKKWDKKYGIAADHTQRFEVNKKGLKLVDDSLGQLDCTKSKTLSDFIKWGVKKYPADRYMLVFWDHGGGPVYGFGYDEWNKDESACLTVAEMREALSTAGVYFDFIGMDCCIMSCLETGLAFYDYCDYAVLSEEFESGLGWSYTGWVKMLMKNSSTPTEDLGKKIIEDTVNANIGNDEWGDSAAMAMLDESMMKVLYTAWTDFAYANESTLLGTNYSRKLTRSRRALPAFRMTSKAKDTFAEIGDYYDYENETYSLSEYYITDMLSVAENIQSDESEALSQAVSQAIVYSMTTSDDADMCGIAVTLPYGSSDFYSSMKKVFKSLGMDSDYISWLKKFTEVSGNTDNYSYDDYDGWDDYSCDGDYDWSDWDYYDDDDYWGDDSWDDTGWCDSQDGYCYDGSCYNEDYWDDEDFWSDEFWDEYYSDYYYDDYYDDDYYDDYYDDWDW